MGSYKNIIKKTALLLMSLAFLCQLGWGQTVLYSEDFTGQNGKGADGNGIDLTGVTWTVDVSGATLSDGNDFFRVVNQRMQARDVDGPAIWYSPVIDISGHTEVGFKLFANNNSNLENSDYLEIAYSIDGGSYQVVETLMGNFANTDFTEQGLSGSTIQLRLTALNNEANERIRFDDIEVWSITLPDLIITEVMYNPCSSTQGSNDDCEFLEIFNAGSTAVDMTDYSLSGSVGYDFSGGNAITIAAGEYIVLARRPNQLSGCGYSVPGGTQVIDWGGENLGNGTGSLTLADENGFIVDEFSYDDGNGGGSCSTDADGNCSSLQYTGFGDNSSCATGYWDVSTPTAGAENSAVLPVELLSFKGKLANDKIELQWTTVNEINNDFMAIERSQDGINFQEIGRVAGQGTSSAGKDYAFMDDYPMPGVNYYRLRQVDFDGTMTYHNVIAINNPTPSSGFQVSLFPNPAKDMVQLRWSQESQAATKLSLFDMTGRQLGYFQTDPGVVSYELPVHDLPAGWYVMQIRSGGNMKVMKFQKQ